MLIRTHVRSRRTAILLASTACALALPGLAFAQDNAPAEETAVDEVIVTTQRREERLQDVPAAVNAFTEDQLEKLGIDGSKELGQITPGLNFTQSVFSPQPTIRGIGVRGVGAGDESVVPIYIDGVYQSFIGAADMQFNNIQRIEVVKGPQGALLGRNATGGAINVITKTPGPGFEGKMGVSYGSFNEVIGKAYIAGGTDNIAADLALFGRRDDGYIEDDLRNDTYGYSNGFSARSKVVWTPNDNTELRLAVGYSNYSDVTGEAYRLPNGNSIGARVPGNTVETRDYKSALSYRPYNKLRIANASLTGVFEFEPFTVTAIAGMANNKLRIKADSDGTPLEIATLTYIQVSANEYYETYATSNGDGPFSWIVGAVYYHDISGMSPYSTTYSRSVSTAGVVGAQSVSRTRPRIETNAIAVYGQGTLELGDQWKITLGGRYSTENKDYQSRVGVTTFTYLKGSKTFENFSPTLTIQYSPSDRYNLYFKAGSAFKSGIFNASASNAAAAVPVDPEEVTQYELGMKSDPTSWLRLNLSAYYTDYNGLQSNVRDPVTLSSLLQNAGGATIYGIEGEAFIRASDNFNIRLGAAWLHGEYEDFGAALVSIPQTTTNPPAATPCMLGTGPAIGGNRSVFCDVTGNDIIRTPFLTANIGGDYTIPLGGMGDLVLSGNAYYKGKSYWDTLNYFEEPAVWLFNADLTWNLPGDRFALTLWGENLSDEVYSLTRVISATAETQVLAKPRTVGIELTYNW
ncbi:TonB-dependent receptor [Caulobacter sp. SLTY]|uniref:TonB-dependent receptor n=1 Tax=Caulobacter sp. SLTY TaxID=2683262 RepID=UPI001413362C|nr:TonB-dependent receptor [Caulobacter sp. SLTY]NBB16506.1 TonB-dependent receptor [Caulobacter sp. SLTY]